jgi:hypothetical protein
MARLKIPSQAINVAPFEPTYTTLVIIDGVEVPANALLSVKTTGAAVLTLKAKKKYADGTFKDITINVAGSKTVFIKLTTDQVKFLKTSTGTVEIDSDVVVNIAAISV